MNFRCSENLARLEELEKHYSKSKSFKLKRAATDNELKLRDFINGHLPIDD